MTMDHLTKTSTSGFRTLVPYLSHPRFVYDGLDQAMWPVRLNFDWLAGDDEFERSVFAQQWLFFGTLRTISDYYDIPFDNDDFIISVPSPSGNISHDKFISTERIHFYIAAWARAEQEIGGRVFQGQDADRPESESDLSYRDAKRAAADRFKVYRRPLLLISLVFDKFVKHSTPINSLVWDSLVVLGATLQGTIDQMYGYFEVPTDAGMNFRDFGLRDAAMSFERNISCPGERAHIKALVKGDPCFLFSASRIDRRSLGTVQHSTCSAKHCVASQVDETTYATRRVEECDETNRRCGFLGPEEQMLVAQFTKSSMVPGKLRSITVFKYHKLELKTENLRLYGPFQPQFVALSHVWADGLGNPQGNTLPRCQLFRIQKMVNSLFPSKKWPVPFWIDTLGVPRERQSRKIAISRMRQIYASATKVLVLDRELLRTTSKGFKADEICLRIMCSNWSRRLWTMQESSNLDSVLWRFSDDTLSYNDLKKGVHSDCESIFRGNGLPQSHALRGHLFNAAETVPFGFDNEAGWLLNPSWPIIEGFFEGIGKHDALEASIHHSTSVIKAVSLRDCSRQSDEGLILASLLKSKVTPADLIKIDEAERFRTILIASKFLPVGLLFFDQKRYDEDGYRWIPKTLLLRNAPNGKSLQEDTKLAKEQQYGTPLKVQGSRELAVSVPGFELPNSTSLSAEFYVKLITDGTEGILLQEGWDCTYRASVHLPGHAQLIEDKQISGQSLILLTPHSIWGMPWSFSAAIVCNMDDTSDGTDGLTWVRHEALVEMQKIGWGAEEPGAFVATFYRHKADKTFTSTLFPSRQFAVA